MSEPLVERFDAIVVGAGQAGPALAERLGRGGLHVAGRHVRRRLHGGRGANSSALSRCSAEMSSSP